MTAKSADGQYGCFKMPAKERCRRRRSSLEGDHGHVGTGERIDKLEREVTSCSHAGCTDTDLSWILFGKLYQVLKARVRRIASNREHDRRSCSQPQRCQILEGVIGNRLRIENPACDQRSVRGQKDRISILFGLYYCVGADCQSAAGFVECRDGHLQQL